MTRTIELVRACSSHPSHLSMQRADVQTLEFPSPALAAVWGPNSQGKTSLAEAVEFLLTGQIVRRALMASDQDDFADALCNVHLPPGRGLGIRRWEPEQDKLQKPVHVAVVISRDRSHVVEG